MKTLITQAYERLSFLLIMIKYHKKYLYKLKVYNVSKYNMQSLPEIEFFVNNTNHVYNLVLEIIYCLKNNQYYAYLLYHNFFRNMFFFLLDNLKHLVY